MTSSYDTFGFSVRVNDAYDVPDDNSETKIVQAGVEAFISVTPEETYSTPEVLNQKLNIRKCYGPEEISLETTRMYSYVNCMNECRRAIILDACNCSSFFHPTTGNEQLCTMQQLYCLAKLRSRVYFMIPSLIRW